MWLNLLILLSFFISANLYAELEQYISEENIQDTLKNSPTSLKKAYKEGCQSGNRILCLPAKCIEGDKNACALYSKALKNKQDFSFFKDLSIKQVFPKASESELEALKQSLLECRRNGKKSNCDDATLLYYRLISESLKNGCNSDTKAACEITKEFNQAKKKQPKLDELGMDALKHKCLNGDKNACYVLERAEKKLK